MFCGEKELNVLKLKLNRWSSWQVWSVGTLLSGTLLQLGSSGWAAVPKTTLTEPRRAIAKDELLRDQRLSQEMVELSIPREGAPDFDPELMRLSSSERQYREKLPGLSGHSRLRSVVARVTAQPYKSKK